MTIIAAIKREDEVWIGADSYWGREGCRNSGSSDTNKLIRFKHFWVAIGGLSLIRDVLYGIKWDTPIACKKDARAFAKRVFAAVKKEVKSGLFNDENYLDEVGGTVFIIATPDQIYEVEHNMSCFTNDRYLCLGAGADYCTGAIEMMYDSPHIDTGDLLRSSIDAACRLSNTCAPPITVLNVKYEYQPGRGKRVK